MRQVATIPLRLVALVGVLAVLGTLLQPTSLLAGSGAAPFPMGEVPPARIAPSGLAGLAVGSGLAVGDLASPTPTATPAATPPTGPVSVRLNPAVVSAGAGDVFDLDIVIDAGAQQFNAAQAYLTFSPGALEVVPYQADPVRWLRPGAALPLEVPTANLADIAAGTLSYAAGITGATLGGTVVLATVRFRAGSASDGSLAFELDAPSGRFTKVTSADGTDLLQGRTTGAAVHVQAGTPTATPTAGATPTATPTPATQRIPLHSGWNWISFAVGLSGPVGSVLSSVEGSYDYVLGEAGTYSPSPPYPGANSLSALERGKGYFLRMTRSADLVVQGPAMAPDTAMALTPGWHWVGFLPATAQDLPAALDRSIQGRYDFVVGENGTHAPPPAQQFLNTLTRMEPGRGYLIRMNQEGSLAYSPGG